MSPVQYDVTEEHELDAFGNIIVKKQVVEVAPVVEEPVVEKKKVKSTKKK